MASNLFHSPEHRPDPAHWTRTNVGLSSPLWWPFLMAAGAGAAWWTYTNWSRIAANSWTGDLQRLGGASGDGGSSAAETTGWSLAQNLAVQGQSAAEVPKEEADEGVDDGSDAIDAAYAANLGPVPAPKKRAAKKAAGGGGAAGKVASKSAAKKTPAKKTAAKKTAARKTTARKTATKKTPAKRGR